MYSTCQVSSTDAKPFIWTAAADETLARIHAQTHVKKPVRQLEVTHTESGDARERVESLPMLEGIHEAIQAREATDRRENR